MVTGSRDRGLNILRRAVDIAVEIELDGDLRRALRARRTHRADAGDGGELVFQRRRHAGRHRFRIGARQGCRHHDGGKIDGGKLADRQRGISEQAEDHQSRHEQDGHDRAADEGFGDIHRAAAAFWPCAPLLPAMVTGLPGITRSWPSVMTFWPILSLP